MDGSLVLDRNALFEANQEWAAKIARDWARRKLPPKFDPQDLEQEARIECWKRSQIWDETRKVPFQAYAYIYVLNAARMYARRRNWAEAVAPEVDTGAVDPRPYGERAIEGERERVREDEEIRQQLARVEAEVATMPVADAYLVRRVYLDGEAVEDVAENWKQEPGKLKRRLSAATRTLKRSLAPPPVELAEEAPQPPAYREYHGRDVLKLLRARVWGAGIKAPASAPQPDAETCAISQTTEAVEAREPAKCVPVSVVRQDRTAPPAAASPAIAAHVQERDAQPSASAPPPPAPPLAAIQEQHESLETNERTQPMNSHALYAAVLADLEKLKADAELGIQALRRLMSREPGEAPAAAAGASAPRSRPAQGAEAPATVRIIAFLGGNPATSYAQAEIASALGIASTQSLRGTLQKLTSSGKITRTERGRYQASTSRPAPAVESSAVDRV